MKKHIIFLLVIVIAFTPIQFVSAGNKNFYDVQPGQWFYNDIQRLVAIGGISGFGDGSFRPQNTITRAEIITLLINSLKVQTVSGEQFDDTANHWSKEYISTAISNNIIIKDEYGRNFKPDAPVTRIEIAYMLLRSLQIEADDVSGSPFADVNDGYLTSAYFKYLIMGNETSKGRYYYPNNNATRAEATSIAVRAIDYKADPEGYKIIKENDFINTETPIENVSDLPSTVQITSPQDFKKKIMTAVYLKKNSIKLEINNYSEEDYNLENINTYVSKVNYERCISKGYIAEYNVKQKISWISDSSAKTAIFDIKFSYKGLTNIDVANLIKVRAANDLYTVLEKAVQNKNQSVTLVLKDNNIQYYDLDKAISYANNEKLMEMGYYASLDSGRELNFSNNKLITCQISYNNLPFNYSQVKKAETYEEYSSIIEEALKAKNNSVNIAIKDYNGDRYNLGALLYNLNQNFLSKNGYCAYVINNDVYNTNPYVLSINFGYSATDGSIISADDEGKPIISSSKEWYELLRDAVRNLEDKIEYNYTYSADVGNAMSIMLELNPDLNYVKSWTYSSSGIIEIKYKYSIGQLKEIKNKTYEKAEKIISQVIKDGMSELDKARALHDYIILNSKYDYDNYLKDTIPEESNIAYGVLVKGTGVCGGYAAAFKLLAEMCGIKCIGVSGTANGGSHAWNMVKLDGKIGYVDVTWDDPVPDREGVVSYDYFNISEAQIAKDHIWNKTLFADVYLEY